MRQILLFLLLTSTSFNLLGQGISIGGGTASGKNSFSYGTNTTASGEASIAGGINSEAKNISSVAIGEVANAWADYAIAIGQSTFVGATGGVAIGSGCNIQSPSAHSVAIGLNNKVESGASYSAVIGAGNTVDRVGALAIGRDNIANGASSVAMGTWNIAQSYGEVVLGSYVDTLGYSGFNRDGWKADDRLFVLGNGVGDGAGNGTRSNALVVLKSGDASFQGGLTIGSLETAIDADEDTKLVVYGGSILSGKSDLSEQLLVGTNVRNNEAKVIIANNGFPYAMKVQGYGSTSGKALQVEGGAEIVGDLTVTGSIAKGGGTFKIDHPLDPRNKYLYHSFIESPDMMNIYNGNLITDSEGNAEVTLPDYFEALNMDFRYQLTPIGQFAQAIISKKIEGNHFQVKTDKPNVEVSWMVTGIRKDPYANLNRVQVSVDKPNAEKGTYMHAKAYGVNDSDAQPKTNQ
ncbi:hypothetical protein SAMN06298216_0792 [Spirosomataceae bacterium TFI 002]|nr:hypothetical protein SAMN06298216_0792 [Spirosomataceae bacterium TFI 002]